MEEDKEPIKIKLGQFLTICIIIIAVVIYLMAQLVKTESRLNKVENRINEQEENIVQEEREILEEVENEVEEDDEEEIIEDQEEVNASDISDTYGDDKIFKIKSYEENGGKITLKGEEYERLKMSKAEIEELAKKGTYKMPETVLFSDGEVYVVKKDYKEGNAVYDYAFLYKWNDEEMIRYIAIKKDKNTYYIDNTTENSRTWTSRGEIEYTIEKETECTYGMEGEETDTIENVVKKELYFGGFFKAVLDEGKCIGINEEVIGY